MKYKVGDVVRIREWDEMEKEFGLNDFGDIKCPYTFASGMKEFCGREGTIYDCLGNCYKMLFDGEVEIWQFSDAMIDHKYAQGGIKVPGIKKVIYNNPATIVFWKDGTKTVVKAQDDQYDKMVGLAMCICKKVLGNKGNYYNVFKKWI